MGTTRFDGYVQKDNGMLIQLIKYYSKKEILINPLHIVCAEMIHDEVVITLTGNGEKVRVLETLKEIDQKTSNLFK